jgi:L-fuculose-phosphate aldolase
MRDEAVRHSVVGLCLELSGRGFLAGTGGNVALRIDAEHFAVTPSATDYEEMQAADVSVMRLADLRQVEGDKPPSVETALHAHVLRLRPDCDCSIHTHQPLASACALLDHPLLVHDPAQRELLGAEIPLVGYAPSGTGWLAGKLARAVRPQVNAYLMRNHGVLCCGPDVASAVQVVEALETLAAGHLRRCILGRLASAAHERPALTRVLQALDPFVSPLSFS